MSQIDSVPGPLTVAEQERLVSVADRIVEMAQRNAWRRPKMTTLVEEFAEAVLASRGKHDDPLHLELMQIASICLNLLWQQEMYGDEVIANLNSRKEKLFLTYLKEWVSIISTPHIRTTEQERNLYTNTIELLDEYYPNWKETNT